TIIFGVLLLFAAASEMTGLARRMRFHGSVAWVAGAVSGVLGGLVGNQGGICGDGYGGGTARRLCADARLFADAAR
ncbi:MAG TPA: hypothetical protein VH701_06035, partial [Vicinamibacterales bacterium]